MKILHIASALPKISGGSTFCVELCDKLDLLGHKVTIAICDPEDRDIYPSRQHVAIIAIKSLFKLRSRDIFDVIHFHGLWHPLLHKVGVWAYKQRIPIVWSPHGMLAPWALHHKWWKKLLAWYIYQKQDLLRVSLFHATSELEVQWIRQRGFNQPCCVVPLGTHVPDLIDKPELYSNRHLGKQDNNKFALFVGRIDTVKNLGALVIAFAETKQKGAGGGWHLLIVGPDQADYKVELLRLAKSLGLGVSDLTNSYPGIGELIKCKIDYDILFTGAVFGEQKDHLYKFADLFVLPSHTENFAGVVVDALAFGVPVMVSDKTPWAEVEDIRCGKICPTDVGGITAVLSQLMALTDAERSEVGRRGRRLVECRYTWDAVAKQMVGAYQELLNGENRTL